MKLAQEILAISSMRVRRDFLTGSTHHTVTAANAYLRNAGAYVASSQSDRTAQVVAYARDLITNLTLVTSDASIISLFQTVIDVLEGTTSTFGTSTYPTTAGSYQTAPRIAGLALVFSLILHHYSQMLVIIFRKLIRMFTTIMLNVQEILATSLMQFEEIWCSAPTIIR